MWHSNPNITLRRAFTLVEMLVVLTVGSATVGIATSALFAVIRTERIGRDRIPQVYAFAQLAEQYRADAHAADNIAPDNTPEHQQFLFADGRRVSYRVQTSEIERLEQSTDRRIRCEAYRLPEGTTTSFTTDKNSSPTVVGILIENKPDALPKRSWRIEANLGHDHRFRSADGEGQ